MPREAQRRRRPASSGLGVEQRFDVGLPQTAPPARPGGWGSGRDLARSGRSAVRHRLAQPGPAPLAVRGRGAGGRRRREGLVRPVGGPAVPLLGQAEAAGQAGDDRADRPVLDPVLLVPVELVDPLVAHLGDAELGPLEILGSTAGGTPDQGDESFGDVVALAGAARLAVGLVAGAQAVGGAGCAAPGPAAPSGHGGRRRGRGPRPPGHRALSPGCLGAGCPASGRSAWTIALAPAASTSLMPISAMRVSIPICCSARLRQWAWTSRSGSALLSIERIMNKKARRARNEHCVNNAP